MALWSRSRSHGSSGWLGPGGTEHTLWTLKMNQAGYLCLGLAGLSLALDRFLSGSTSWMRYVGTATSIQTAIEQFRLDWDKLRASLAGQTPAGQDLAALINRITEFSVTVRALVESETKAWVAEFQTNLAELQKNTAAAVESARAEVQAAQQKADTEQQAARPGGIDLIVDNAAETDQGYEVLVDRVSARSGVTSKTCGILGIPPGLHELSVQAKIGSVSAEASQLVTIAAGAATKVQLSLAKQKMRGAGPQALSVT
ncbi:MAG TPA: SLATT domain-containing protein, partial [Polyangia bacterium]|nr:SLATT domain-containing protein [Polyangia bacterium]